MLNLSSLLNLASIVIGFVAGICFCIGAAKMKTKDIARSCQTVAGWNSAQTKSLSEQRAQYLIGAWFLVFSFVLQAVAILVPKEFQIAIPFILQLPLVQFLVFLLFAGLIAVFAILNISKRTETAVQKILKGI